MQTRTGLVVVLMLALLAPAAPLAADPVSGQSGAIAQPGVIAQPAGVEADSVRITVRLRENGSAAWTVAFRTVLDSENRTAAFDSLQSDIDATPDAYTAPFADRIRNTVAVAENETDREMAADGFSIDTTKQSLARDYGIVTYRFSWAGFANVTGDTLRAGDAIDGFYLADGTKLRIEWPSEYTRQSVAPDPDETHENAVAWVGGQTDFVSGQPRVAVAPGGPGLGLVGGIVVALLVLVAGWFVTRQRGDDGAAVVTPTATADTATAAADATADAGATGAAGATDTDAAADSAADDAAVTDAERSSEPDPELLSNEEQVVKLLDENGGRMKQKRVVEELGWTDAKTSKVVSGLREEGEIESFRIGRENVLTFPDEGLTDE
ncbi:MAG: hypothetical protein A07HN63_01003 [uncultured archaeon A07HN63]|nr:MAG: hypothetical protein A07HN63_01003 [uncultured archaeon A07HN63]